MIAVFSATETEPAEVINGGRASVASIWVDWVVALELVIVMDALLPEVTAVAAWVTSVSCAKACAPEMEFRTEATLAPPVFWAAVAMTLFTAAAA